MDALSEVLKSVRLSGAAFFNAEFKAPWGFTSPPMDKLGHLLPLGGGRVVLYHLVLEGHATARLTDGTEIALEGGDLVVIPHGDGHVMWHGRPTRWHDMVPDVVRALGGELGISRAGGTGEVTRFVCGYFGCERPAGHLFLEGLPRILKIRLRGANEGGWIERAISQLVMEDSAEDAGRLAFLARLSEALFVETLRRYLLALPPGETGWLAGTRDPMTGRALALLHGDPARPWRNDTLARELGTSRSVLVDRFKHFLGEPPMAYLTRWRLQLGARLLETTTRSVLEIAADVGYESEAAFNRAFKRLFRTPPGRYRRGVADRSAESAGPRGRA